METARGALLRLALLVSLLVVRPLWLTAPAAVVLWSCGPTGKSGPDPFFDAFEPVSEAPPGATVVSADDFKALLAQTEHVALDAAYTQRIADARAQAEANRQKVAQYVADHPDQARRFVRASSDDDFPLSVPGLPGKVMVMGNRAAEGEFAAALERYPTRENQRSLYELLYEALPPDERQGLLSPADAADAPNLGPMVVALAEKSSPVQPKPQAIDPWPPGYPSAATDELHADPATAKLCNGWPELFWAWSDFPLKPFTGKFVRDQGARGTCGMHSVAAIIERRRARDTGEFMNLSEQALYGRYLGDWYPTAGAYGDGSWPLSGLQKLKSLTLPLKGESAVVYNPSLQRLDSPVQKTYLKSCVDYGGVCGDTNHQQEVVCTFVPNKGTVCSVVLAPGATVPGTVPVSFTVLGTEWNSTTQSALLAALKLGNPVSFALTVTDEPYFVDHWGHEQPGLLVTGLFGGPDKEGKHAEEAVGVLLDDELTAGPLAELVSAGLTGGGLVIMRNSWGCVGGDHGYYYYTFNYLKHRFVSAVALTKLDRAAPRVSLSSTATGPVTQNSVVTLKAVAPPQVNSLPIARMEFYRGRTKLGEVAVADDAQAGLYTFNLSLNATLNGRRTYWARAVALENGEERPGLSKAYELVVAIDNTPPTVWIAAPSDKTTQGPTLYLSAFATDTSEVQKVELLEGNTVLGSHPFGFSSFAVPVTSAQNGLHTYTARATDVAGNVAISEPYSAFVAVPTQGPPEILSFTATPKTLPATVPDGGVSVTLEWQYVGGKTAKITPAVFSSSLDVPWSSQTVTVTGPMTYTLIVSNDAGVVTATAEVKSADVVAPTVSLGASATGTISAPTTLSLTANATDDRGVTRVDFYDGPTLLGTDTTTPFTWAVPLSAAQNGPHSFVARARDEALNEGQSNAVAVNVAIVPVISAFAAMPSSFPIGGGTTTLVWSVSGASSLSIDQGVGTVTGTMVTRAVPATTTFTLTASNAAGNATAQVTVTVQADTQPPTVSLVGDLASPVTSAQTLTLTATAADDVGVTQVDFYDGPVLLGSDALAPFTRVVALGASTNGAHSFTAVAHDAAGHSTSSAPFALTVAIVPTISSFTATPSMLPIGGGSTALAWAVSDADTVSIDQGVGAVSGTSTSRTVTTTTTFTLTAANPAGQATAQVTVTVATPLDVYVSPGGNDSNPGTALLPMRSIQRALNLAATGRSVFLAPGTYDSTTQPTFAAGSTTPLTVPAGRTVRGATGVVLKAQGGPGFLIAGGGSLLDLIFEDFGTAVRAEGSGATTVQGCLFRRTTSLSPAPYTLSVAGSAVVTLTPGALPNLVGAKVANLAKIEGSGVLNFNGGTVDGLGGSAGPEDAAFLVTDSGQLTFSGTVRNSSQSQAVRLLLGAQASLNNATLEHAGAVAAVQLEGANTFTCTNSSVLDSELGLLVPAGAGSTVQVTSNGCTFSNNLSDGLRVGPGNGPGTFTFATTGFSGNLGAGLALESSATLNLSLCTATGNSGRGLELLGTTSHFQAVVRSTSITSNTAGGVRLMGDATSTFNFGSVSAPGNNTFTGNGTVNFASAADPAVRVLAVGNTWVPGLQRADANGHYSVMGPSGSVFEEIGVVSVGPNYTIEQVGSRVRLAEQP